MNKHDAVKNPWRLTLGMVDVMDELRATGSFEAVAKRLKCTPRAAHYQANKIRRRMGVETTFRALAMWTEWRVGEGKDIPA